jgi:hypothetical protein
MATHGPQRKLTPGAMLGGSRLGVLLFVERARRERLIPSGE